MEDEHQWVKEVLSGKKNRGTANFGGTPINIQRIDEEKANIDFKKIY